MSVSTTGGGLIRVDADTTPVSVVAGGPTRLSAHDAIGSA
jgi:hypothetical protein